jgi:hypothetical protein
VEDTIASNVGMIRLAVCIHFENQLYVVSLTNLGNMDGAGDSASSVEGEGCTTFYRFVLSHQTTLSFEIQANSHEPESEIAGARTG